MAGVSYTWSVRGTSVSPRIVAGYSFNRLRGAGSAKDSLAWKPEVQIWRDVTSRAGIHVSVGYLVARPEVTIVRDSSAFTRRVKADAARMQVGVAYALF
jgi:hypothetical protein